MRFLYDVFAILAMAGGIYSGVYFSGHLPLVYKKDRLLFFLMFAYTVASFWLAGVYLMTLLGFIESAILTIGMYTRPATMAMLWIPPLIMQRVRL